MSLCLKNLKKRELSSEINKPAKKSSRFDGLSEEEVKKNTLKDILEDDLDLVFIGINPSLMAAHTGRYYAGPGNHFYKLLYESKLIPEAITYEEDQRLLEHKIGLTNIVARATRSSADLSKSEIRKGATFVKEKLKCFRPKIAIFNGKCIYEEFVEKFDKSSFHFGLQPTRVGDTALWVVPSSSARCANFPRMQDKLHFYTSLKKYLAYLKNEIEEVNLNEFYFEGTCKQAIASTSKMWRRKGISAFANGGRIVNKETICMNTSDENILIIPQSTEFILSKIENNDLEKDSGISTSQSDYSQEISEDNDVKPTKNNSNQQNTSRLRKTRTKKALKQSTVTVDRQNKDYSQSTDFMNLIKERLRNKNENANKYEKKDCHQTQSDNQSDNNIKGLRFGKLRSSKQKRNIKIKTDEDI
jgi:mismatch-specific thymine-DNA glycosylase